ncbi:hypothetical protein [Dyadobacter sp. CY347]|uniref:hypothetical protein n=1 Tax=Dyadobacter sp. CY347 TaxID=2909336 RepID=UPI001F1EFB6A|nr:hypothetical protein [Dyadobacter sp. CY347]MCF2491615.1 hypothetical protein [Dyadobacter sp. CY347]
MNIKDAKSIPLDEFLENLGHSFAKEVRGRKWYKRPWGDERTASFVVTPDKLAWYDHGEGVGGNILDLAIRYANLRDVAEALRYIEQVMGRGYIIQSPTIGYKKLEPEVPHYTLISFDDFKLYKRREPTAHAKYLAGRGINLERAALYLQEITFYHKEVPKVKYSAFALPNESGGYEGRGNLFGTGYNTTTVGTKDVTIIRARDTIHGAYDWHTKSWRAFYSMMDFLTFISTDDQKPGAYNFLVIHGDAMIHKAAEYMNDLPAGNMVHFPHIDPNGNGQRAMFDLMAETSSWRHFEISHEYEGFKDLNESHMHKLGLDYRPASNFARPVRRNTPPLKP